MYTLTLTSEERRAFDWIGNRYATGDDFADVLRDCMGENDEWDAKGDISFAIPEHQAWELARLNEEENYFWPCFSRDLADKLDRFLNQIV